ncbi:MAG TPA: hypothetical protein PKC76_04040 [Saprospiraceae bacterium]|nr:hypothetical protein [Saprospiraceae bacterium]HMP23273.1 hypothetical protein [Saprospiraceae bacterium]
MKIVPTASASRFSGNYTSKAWLLRGLTQSLPGVLALRHDQLTFTATGFGTLWMRDLRRLEQRAGMPGLAERLNRGEATVVFQWSATELQAVRFPWYYFGGGLQLQGPDQSYRISFIRPGNTRLHYFVNPFREIAQARHIGRRWRALL